MQENIKAFEAYLVEEEKAAATVAQYGRDVRAFVAWLGDRELDKGAVVAYKRHLSERYAPASVNAALSSLNRFFAFIGRHELRVKHVKIQRQIFAPADRELTRGEYERLLQAARDRKNERLYLLMQTICSTGIRVSEVRYVTVEAIGRGMAQIACKGKRRQVFLPGRLCQLLKQYAKEQKIKSGAVFVTKHGNPLDRSNVWSDMKRLCREAGVAPGKVFPHTPKRLDRIFSSVLAISPIV